MADLATSAAKSRLWRLCKQAGAAPHLSALYWRVKLAVNLWSVSATVDGHTATFATDSAIEYERATSLVGERRVVATLLDDVRPSDVVYDVGANVGTHTCFVGDKLRDGVVVAFEPMPTNLARLRHNLSLNVPPDRWRVADVALSNENDTGTLCVESEAYGEGNHALAADGELAVEVRRGETLVADGDYPPPDVLKIDVEGAELQVLRGCEALLDDVRVIYVELHHDLSEAYGTSTDEIESFLDAHGFAVERLNERSGAYHVRATPEKNEPSTTENRNRTAD